LRFRIDGLAFLRKNCPQLSSSGVNYPPFLGPFKNPPACSTSGSPVLIRTPSLSARREEKMEKKIEQT
jgi:hypothetical protein